MRNAKGVALRRIASTFIMVLASCTGSCNEESTAPVVSTIEGTVVDAQSGAPLADALVSTQPASAQSITNAQGSFRIPGTNLRGTVLVVAAREGYNTTSVSVNVREGGTTNAALRMNRPTPPPRVFSITVSPPRAEIVLGAKLQMIATLKDSVGNVLSGRVVTWQSTDPTVATVSPEGTVTALKVGTAGITGASEGVISEPAIIVVIAPDPPGRVDVGASRDTLAVGDTAAITVAVYSVSGARITRLATITSSHPEVGRLEQTDLMAGRLVAVLPGATVVTARVDSVRGERTIVVVPRRVVARVHSIPDSGGLALGDSLRIIATPLDSAGNAISGRQVRFRSTNQAIATVDSVSGWVKAVSLGTAIIEATCDGQTGVTKVTVVGNEVTSIVVAQQPSGGTTGTPLSATVVELRNAAGQLVTSATDMVTVSLRAQPGYQSVLSGTLTVASQGGRAQFNNLVFSNPLPAVLEFRVVGKPNIPIDTTGSFVVDLAGARTFTQISAGAEWFLGLTPTGTAFSWGNNASGRLGVGDTRPSSSIPVPVLLPLPVKEIAAGSTHALARQLDDAVLCWGANSDAQCRGTTSPSSFLAPALIPALKAGAIFTGPISAHTCYLVATISWCGGRNVAGELGNGRQGNTGAFEPVAGGLAFDSMALGRGHTCGRLSSGVLYCWGSQSNGQTGSGQTSNVALRFPSVVVGGRTWRAVAAGDLFTCAIETGTGDAYCWGYSGNGRLGDGSIGTVNKSSPVRVAAPANVRFTQIVTGQAHACALTSAGEAFCWGEGGSGRLGNGSTLDQRSPVAIPTFRFRQLAAGIDATCGITLSNTVWCWGQNDDGQLGNGTTTSFSRPLPIARP